MLDHEAQGHAAWRVIFLIFAFTQLLTTLLANPLPLPMDKQVASTMKTVLSLGFRPRDRANRLVGSQKNELRRAAEYYQGVHDAALEIVSCGFWPRSKDSDFPAEIAQIRNAKDVSLSQLSAIYMHKLGVLESEVQHLDDLRTKALGYLRTVDKPELEEKLRNYSARLNRVIGELLEPPNKHELEGINPQAQATSFQIDFMKNWLRRKRRNIRVLAGLVPDGSVKALPKLSNSKYSEERQEGEVEEETEEEEPHFYAPSSPYEPERHVASSSHLPTPIGSPLNPERYGSSSGSGAGSSSQGLHGVSERRRRQNRPS